MVEVILSDLDSTLCNTHHRESLAAVNPSGTDDWIPYSKACINDEPIMGTLTALKILALKLPVFYVSGRNIEAEAETREWLAHWGAPLTHLRLHKPDDIAHNGHYKVAHIRELRAMGVNPVLMFEDNLEVSQMIQAEGVPVVTVRPWYDDLVGVNANHVGGTG